MLCFQIESPISMYVALAAAELVEWEQIIPWVKALVVAEGVLLILSLLWLMLTLAIKSMLALVEHIQGVL